MQTSVCERFGITLSIIQAPKANVTTPELVAAVSNAGAHELLDAWALLRQGIVEPGRESGPYADRFNPTC